MQLQRKSGYGVGHLARRYGPWTLAGFLWRLPATLRLLFRLLRDARVAVPAKLLLVGGAAYAIMPFDLLTDLMPLLGQMDDLALFGLVCRMFLQLCPPEVVAEHRAPEAAAVAVSA